MNPETIIAILGLTSLFGLLTTAVYWNSAKKLQSRIDSNEKDKEGIRDELIKTRTELALAQKNEENLKSQLEQVGEYIKDSVENLSSKIVMDGIESLAKRNKELVSKDFESITTTVKDFRTRLEELASDSKAEKNTIVKAVEQISGDTQALTQALRGNVKRQGNWGEEVCEELLMSIGLVAGQHYQKQASLADTLQDKTLRPDFEFFVPSEDPSANKKVILLDAKASVKGSEEMAKAKDNKEQDQAKKSIVKSLNDHVETLSSKAYHTLTEGASPEFTLMFVPIPGIIDIACETDEDLYKRAMQKKILLVDSRTLVPVLMILRNLWRLAGQQEKVNEVFAVAGNLLRSIQSFGDNMEDLGTALKRAQKSFTTANNRIVKGGQGSLLTYANQLEELGTQGTIQGGRGRAKQQANQRIENVATEVQTTPLNKEEDVNAEQDEEE